jgi:hypothetical protein
LNEHAIEYIKQFKHKDELIPILEQHLNTKCDTAEQFQNFLERIGINKFNTGKKSLTIIEEGAILGSAIEHDLNPATKLMSDAAGQFNLLILIHALCWIHMERGIKKLVPLDDDERKEIAKVRDDIWKYYKQLKEYKEKPDSALKEKLSTQFDELCRQKVNSQKLGAALARMYEHKTELLVVLDHPDVPLHNNGTESAIRSRRIQEKISGSTRSDEGRGARDIYSSLIKTCRKLGISAWEYFGDRLGKKGKIPPLSELIRQRAKQRAAATAPPRPPNAAPAPCS